MSKKHRRLAKAPKLTPGARQQPVPGIGQGRPSNLPAQRQGGGIQPLDHTGGQSQYVHGRPALPPATIADVDPNNWFSPLQPVWPFAVSGTAATFPREWDYATGYNLKYVPERFEAMQMLRAMPRCWGLLNAVIQTRIDEFLRVPWTFRKRGDSDKRSIGDKWTDMLGEFFRRPDGKRSYNQWARPLLQDVFEIDAPCIYNYKSAAGIPLALLRLDGAGIMPLIDDAGRRPDYPSPAYQQVIKGLPMNSFDETELLYEPLRPRPECPLFGQSPVEQIVVEATEGIRKALYMASFWKEGTIPEMIISVPDAWTPRQIASYQGFFDSTYAGNLAMKSRARFVPGGMKPFELRNASGGSLHNERDEALIRLVCFAIGVSHQPFTKTMNRATAQGAEEEAKSQNLLPLIEAWKSNIMDPIVHRWFGMDDYEWNPLPPEEIDGLKQAQIDDIYVRAGIRTPNDIAQERGFDEVDGGDQALIYTGMGAVPLDSISDLADANVQAARARATAPAPQPGQPGKPAAGKPAGGPAGKAAGPFATPVRSARRWAGY